LSGRLIRSLVQIEVITVVVEKIETVKVVAILFFLLVVLAVGISARAWGDVPNIVTGFGTGSARS
jgi:hypothetical protein